MTTLSVEEICDLLAPYLEVGRSHFDERRLPGIVEQISIYLNLLLRWNQRTNLTAIRDPRQIVTRHFGESLFAARHIGGGGPLLDLGSGAGFPGLPIQLWQPERCVTLAESQNKKATFLREVVRELSLKTEVWAERAELLDQDRRFESVVMRAVDDLDKAVDTAAKLTISDIWLLGSSSSIGTMQGAVEVVHRVPIPDRGGSWIFQLRRTPFHVEHPGEM